MNAIWKQTRLVGTQVTHKQSHFETVTDPDEKVEMRAITLYTQETDQVFEGLGGAATEAAAYTYAMMPPDKQDEMLEMYFGKDGANYRFLRVSVDSCDFSNGHYEAMSDRHDTALQSFSLQRDLTYVIPMIKAAEKKAGHPLPILLSPWSPPAFMKTTGERNRGGFLKPEYYGFWANYLCRYIKEYRAQGLTIKWITTQNEPNATQKWDSCRYDAAAEKKFIHDFLYPAMVREGLTDVGIYIWDHNKERAYERAMATIDDTTYDEIDGVAFHWYTGDHFEALRLLRKRFPDKKLMYTEGCVGFSHFNPDKQLPAGRMYAHQYLGNLANGTSVLIDWNIYVDEVGGPNHVANYCDAPIICNTKDGTLHPQLSYHYLKAIGQAILPGAVRIEYSCYSDLIDCAAFRNPDGSYVLALLNKGETDAPVNVRIDGHAAACVLEGNALATLTLKA